MDEYSSKDRTDEDGNKVEDAQIVLVYPKAHAMRIANYMTNQSISLEKAKQVKNLFYRLMPNLDISVRTWRWEDMLARLSGNEKSAHWLKVSDRKIEI